MIPLLSNLIKRKIVEENGNIRIECDYSDMKFATRFWEASKDINSLDAFLLLLNKQKNLYESDFCKNLRRKLSFTNVNS